MQTKLAAAEIACASGAATVILHSRDAGSIAACVVSGSFGLGTTFEPSSSPVRKGHKRWITAQTPMGSLMLDDGAVAAVRRGDTLFPVGVRSVDGHFRVSDVVALRDTSGRAVARALVDYGSDEIRRIAGKPSSEIKAALGFSTTSSVCRRSNIAVMRLETAAQAGKDDNDDDEIDGVEA